MRAFPGCIAASGWGSLSQRGKRIVGRTLLLGGSLVPIGQRAVQLDDGISATPSHARAGNLAKEQRKLHVGDGRSCRNVVGDVEGNERSPRRHIAIGPGEQTVPAAAAVIGVVLIERGVFARSNRNRVGKSCGWNNCCRHG